MRIKITIETICGEHKREVIGQSWKGISKPQLKNIKLEAQPLCDHMLLALTSSEPVKLKHKE